MSSNGSRSLHKPGEKWKLSTFLTGVLLRLIADYERLIMLKRTLTILNNILMPLIDDHTVITVSVIAETVKPKRLATANRTGERYFSRQFSCYIWILSTHDTRYLSSIFSMHILSPKMVVFILNTPFCFPYPCWYQSPVQLDGNSQAPETWEEALC